MYKGLSWWWSLFIGYIQFFLYYRACLCLVFVQHSECIQLFRALNSMYVNSSTLMFMHLELLEDSLKALFEQCDGQLLVSHTWKSYANQFISQSCLSAHQHLNKFSTNGFSPLSLLLTIVRSKRLQLDWTVGLHRDRNKDMGSRVATLSRQDSQHWIGQSRPTVSGAVPVFRRCPGVVTGIPW